MDNMRNKVELKEHLDREITYLYLSRRKTPEGTSNEEKDRILMENIYQSCYSGYKNYLLDEKVTRQLSLNCSKYLFFRKASSNLPLDRLFRYTSQLTD